MTLSLEIPDTIAADLLNDRSDLARAVLEDFAVESYRQGRLSTFQIRQLPGHASRWETEDFLAAHEAWPNPTAEEVTSGAETLRQMRPA